MNVVKIDNSRIGSFSSVNEKLFGFNVSGLKNAGGQHPCVVACIVNGDISPGMVSVLMLQLL